MDFEFPAQGAIETCVPIQSLPHLVLCDGRQTPTTAKRQTLSHRRTPLVPSQRLRHPSALCQRMPRLVDSALIAIVDSQFQSQGRGWPRMLVHQRST